MNNSKFKWSELMQMKNWRELEAVRNDITPSAVAMRLARGFYKRKLRIVRRNARLIYVAVKVEVAA